MAKRRAPKPDRNRLGKVAAGLVLRFLILDPYGGP